VWKIAAVFALGHRVAPLGWFLVSAMDYLRDACHEVIREASTRRATLLPEHDLKQAGNQRIGVLGGGPDASVAFGVVRFTHGSSPGAGIPAPFRRTPWVSTFFFMQVALARRR